MSDRSVRADMDWAMNLAMVAQAGGGMETVPNLSDDDLERFVDVGASYVAASAAYQARTLVMIADKLREIAAIDTPPAAFVERFRACVTEYVERHEKHMAKFREHALETPQTEWLMAQLMESRALIDPLVVALGV